MTSENAQTGARGERTDDGPVAIVTGATGNLGRAVITRLQADGIRVVGAERALLRYRDESLGAIDLGRPESVATGFAGVVQRLGRLDAVVHTVGVYRGGRSLRDTKVEDFTSSFETNVITTANVLRAALELLLPQGSGRLAVVSSADAVQGVAGQSAYGASKAAQLRLVESVAEEIRGRGVTLNAVLPGTMDTPQNRAAMPDVDRSRWVSLQAVADVLAFLVSPQASAIHGRAIRVGA